MTKDEIRQMGEFGGSTNPRGGMGESSKDILPGVHYASPPLFQRELFSFQAGQSQALIFSCMTLIFPPQMILVLRALSLQHSPPDSAVLKGAWSG